jgi:Xaa-Pro dipeptidase
MRITDELQTPALDGATAELSALPPPTRRDDVEVRQEVVARLLAELGCEGLLLFEPANVRWMTAGAGARSVYGPDEPPLLYVGLNQRWLLCSSIDTQRFFDEELDGLGFQVKEWPWTGSREQHVLDVCAGRKIASDRPFRDAKLAAAWVEQERRRLSAFERERARELGRILAHALEATARNLQIGETEQEIAGQLAHRLVKRGAEAVAVQVCADDRARGNARPGATVAPVTSRCLLQATAGKFGVFLTASRTTCFGEPTAAFKAEYDAAAQLHAVWLAMLRAGPRPAALFAASRTVLAGTPFEHDWRLAPPGWWAGREPSEGPLLPASPHRFEAGQLVVLNARVSGASLCETVAVAESGAFPLTDVEEWPVRRYVIQGMRFDAPDLLVRIPE